MRFNSLQEWLNWLESCHPSSEIELGLERIGQVARRLGFSPTLATTQVITVAGTNGKGSCVAALNALLHSAGLQVGCYTSPHLLHYNERIVINGKPVSDQLLIESFERVDQARQSIELTYFEFGTLVALDIFQRSVVDVVVLEVGLGGRLDAVNIIDPGIAIVTSIDLDHQDWLGPDRDSIAREKAGVFRPGKPAVCADPNPPNAIKATADAVGTTLLQRGNDFDITRQSAKRWLWTGLLASGEKTTIELVDLALPEGSIAAALQALQLLNIPNATFNYRCLDDLVLPGRFQSFTITVNGRGADNGNNTVTSVETEAGTVRDTHAIQVILDVAHNPAAASYLAEKLNSMPVSGRTFALLAMMKDKDCANVVNALKASIDKWFVAGLNGFSRAMPASDLADIMNEQGIKAVNISQSVERAYQSALTLMRPGDRLMVLGSFITVSEVMTILQQDIAQPIALPIAPQQTIGAGDTL